MAKDSVLLRHDDVSRGKMVPDVSTTEDKSAAVLQYIAKQSNTVS
jgi:hypothetical protein